MPKQCEAICPFYLPSLIVLCAQVFAALGAWIVFVVVTLAVAVGLTVQIALSSPTKLT